MARTAARAPATVLGVRDRSPLPVFVVLAVVLAGCLPPFGEGAYGEPEGFQYVLIRDNGGPRMDTPSSTWTDGVDIAGVRVDPWDEGDWVDADRRPSRDEEGWCGFGDGQNGGAPHCSGAWNTYRPEALYEPSCHPPDETDHSVGVYTTGDFVSLGGWLGWVVVVMEEPLTSGDRVEVYECLPSDVLDPEQQATPEAEQESYDILVGSGDVLEDGLPDPESEFWEPCGWSFTGPDGCDFVEP